jgi:uncharacterized protein with beta-barrel porin domain
VSGKRVKALTFTTATGTSVTLKLTGNGTVEALQDGNAVDLVITGSNLHLSAASFSAFTLGAVTVTGSLASLKANSATLAGTLSATGNLGTITLGSITGTISASGKLQHLAANSASADSHFQASSFGVIKLPGRVHFADDSRFDV